MSATLSRVSRPSVRKLVHLGALAIGLLALAYLFDRLGSASIRRAVVETGAWFAVIAGLDLLSVGCDAAAFHCYVQPLAPISYARVFAAQVSGLAINRLTPGNSLGEPIKVTMLMPQVPEAAAVSAVILFNMTTISVAVSSIMIGVPLTLLTLDLPSRVELAVMIVTTVLVVFAIGLVVLARRGALATLIHALAGLRLISRARAAQWERRISGVDANVRQFGGATTRRALIFVIAARILNWTGTIVILHVADVPVTAPLVIGVLSVGLLVTWISNVIPLGLGLADGGNYMLYGVLGSAPAAGLEFTMVNRVRTCLLASMGLAVMAIANVVDRPPRGR
ncbi:MAG: hypothetical protein H6Q90_1743 [Deltaproteobacteria bacterium]|nr:hypothetical protein [Deltaproteobacteria bacterium]